MDDRSATARRTAALHVRRRPAFVSGTAASSPSRTRRATAHRAKTPTPSPCGNRTLEADFGSGFVPFTPFTNARNAAQLAQGQSRDQVMVFSNHENRACERFIFEPDSGSGVTLTRLTGDQFGNGNGEWTVESAGDHKAGCYNWSKGAYRQTGGRVALAFRARFVEVKYPF